MKNPKIFSVLRVLIVALLGLVTLMFGLWLPSSTKAAPSQKQPYAQNLALAFTTTSSPTVSSSAIPTDIPLDLGGTFDPAWMPISENVARTFGPVWRVADEVLAAVVAKAGEPARLQYSAGSGPVQDEFKRGQTVQLNYFGFAPNQSVNVGLYRYDDQQKTLTLMNQALLQTDSQGLFDAELPVPSNAPSGRYFLAACGLGVCSPESIFTQLADPQIVWGSFSLPQRINDFSVVVVPDTFNATDMFDTAWKTETPLKDEIVRIVVFREGKVYTEQTINFANAVDRSLFLNPDGTGTQLYGQLPALPGLSNVVPKLNRWIPGVTQGLQNQPIEPGDYQMKFYINNFLEAAKEFRIEK